MAVHLYGSISDMDALLDIGRRHGLPVIEDAAESMGSRWKNGKRTGTMGAFSAFSFHGSKTMTTGEGGMFATNDDRLAHTVKALNAHGRVPGQTKQFWADMIGYKYKMSNIQAALGCAQLSRVEELIERRREIMHAYQARLGNLPLALNIEPEGTMNGYWMPTIVVNRDVSFDRDALLDDMRAHNIDARVFFWPLSKAPAHDPHRLRQRPLPPLCRGRRARRGPRVPVRRRRLRGVRGEGRAPGGRDAAYGAAGAVARASWACRSRCRRGRGRACCARPSGATGCATGSSTCRSRAAPVRATSCSRPPTRRPPWCASPAASRRRSRRRRPRPASA